jgi:hypothetical protein
MMFRATVRQKIGAASPLFFPVIIHNNNPYFLEHSSIYSDLISLYIDFSQE